MDRQHNCFYKKRNVQFYLSLSAFDPSLVMKEQWAAVKHPGSNWGFSVLLKDSLTWNYGERGMAPVTL